ncbi:MAG: OprO/OprP family phosphate-selective porin [Bacteroidales bacterium]|nr:OprO/OprP family phosphate-selective porin [Bacteroidales bacterium]
MRTYQYLWCIAVVKWWRPIRVVDLFVRRYGPLRGDNRTRGEGAMREWAMRRMCRWFVLLLGSGLLGGTQVAHAQAAVPSPPSSPVLPPVGLILPAAVSAPVANRPSLPLPPSTMSPQATPPSLLPPTHLPPLRTTQSAESAVSMGPLAVPQLTPDSSSNSSTTGPIPTLSVPQLPHPVREMPTLALPTPNMPPGVPAPMPAPVAPTPQAPQAPQAPSTPSATATLTLPQGLPESLHPPESPKPATADSPSFQAYWNHGLFVGSPDKEFLFHVGGAVQLDSAWYTAQPSLTTFPGGTGPFRDGTTPRRLRLRTDATVYGNLDFCVEIEFINGFTDGAQPSPRLRDAEVSTIPSLTDVYVVQRDVPLLGNVRIGNQKEPFSLEHLESFRFLPFMEYSYLFDLNYATAFNNGYTPGIAAYNTWANGRIYTHGGFFKNLPAPFAFGLGDGEYAATGRIGLLPILNLDERRLWYIGGAMSRRDPVEGVVTARIRNQVRNAPGPLLNILATTGAVPAESNGIFSLDSAFVSGPLTVLGEFQSNQLYGASTTNGVPLGTVNYNGFYVSTLYFLTGESRTWNTQAYIFNRVIPKSNFLVDKETHGIKGWGAWEVGARYSYLDLNDKTIRGGRLQAVTLGLNWYLNPITKFQFNYDCAYKDLGSNPLAKGIIHSFGTRLNFDF